MSRCRYCNAPVVWVAKEEGSGWYPPMDAPEFAEFSVAWTGTAWVGGPGQTTGIMKLHRCQVRTEAPETTAVLDTHEGPYGDKRVPRELVAEVVQTRLRAHADAVAKRAEDATRAREKAREQAIYTATRLAKKCPTCAAKAFRWCTYLPNLSNDKSGLTGQFTKNLHKERGTS